MAEDPTLFPDPVASPDAGPASLAEDPHLKDVVAWFCCHADLAAKFGAIFRQSFDEVLDGQRIGRFDLGDSSVTKTERTYLGTKVEIVTRAAFEFP